MGRIKFAVGLLVFLVTLYSAYAVVGLATNYDKARKEVVVYEPLTLNEKLKVRMVSNTDECIDCWTDYELYNPTSEDMRLSDFGLNFYNRRLIKTKEVANAGVYVEKLVPESYTQNDYGDCVSERTDENGTLHKTTYRCIKSTTEKQRLIIGWVKVEPQLVVIPSKSSLNLRVRGSLKPLQKVDNRISLLGVEFDEFAWWSANYNRRQNITNISYDDMLFYVNGSNRFYNQSVVFNPADCRGDIAIYYKSADVSDYKLICNDSVDISNPTRPTNYIAVFDYESNEDDYYGGYSATFNNGSLVYNCMVGKCYQFSGQEWLRYGNNGSIIPTAGDWTIMFWAKSDAAQGLYHAVVSQGAGKGGTANGIAWQQGYPQPTVFYLLYGDGVAWRSATYNINLQSEYNWHAYTGTRVTNLHSAYKDDSLTGSTNFATNYGFYNLSVGGDDYQAGRTFVGKVDELNIYSGTANRTAWYKNTKLNATYGILASVEFFITGDIVYLWPLADNSSSVYTNSSPEVRVLFNSSIIDSYNLSVYNPDGVLIGSVADYNLTSPVQANLTVNVNTAGQWLVNATLDEIGTLTSRSVYFTALAEPRSLILAEFDLTTSQNVLLVFVLIIAWFGCIIIGMVFGNPVFSILGYIIGVLVGFMFNTLHPFLTVVIVFINVFAMVQTLMRG